MFPSFKHILNFGNIKGTAYLFEKKGDLLPMHNHVDSNAHITIVSRGSFKVSGKTFTAFKMDAGDIQDWKPETFHEFESLEDNSQLVNLTK